MLARADSRVTNSRPSFSREGQDARGPAVAPPAHTRRAANFAAVAALASLAVVAHAPALVGDWIVDDGHYVTENPLLNDAGGLATIWLQPAASSQYYPLTLTSFWIERQLFGLDPRVFHATNLLLHAAVAVMAWSVLRRLAATGSWLIAVLFAVHPIHVDTVAWISERKNLLAGLFALLAIGLYLDFDRRRAGDGRWRLYVGSLLAFVMAMLSKSAVVGVPVVLASLAWWRRGRLAPRELAPLVPFAAVGAVLAALTVHLESRLVEIGDALATPALHERPLIAARAALFYLGKIAWPSGLSFDYGSWPTGIGEPVNLASALVLLAALALLWARRERWGRGPFVALLVFLVSAAPALGLVSFYFHRYAFVADHFVYLPSLPILALGVAAGDRLLVRRRRPWLGGVIAAGVIAALAATTWSHAHDYRDHETLARSILRVHPSSWLAHNHLGNEALRRGELAAALEHLERAEQAAPGRIETQVNLALAKMNSGDLAGAEAAARRVVALRDGAEIGHRLLGDTLLRAGRFEAAVVSYAAALERDPTALRSRAGLGLAQSQAGHHAAAIATLSVVVADDPANVAARTALSYSLAARGRRDEAIVQLERALSLAPGDPRLVRNLELLRAGGPP